MFKLIIMKMILWIKKTLGLVIKKLDRETISSEKALKEDMKYLIVGLGNMESSYENTRHNIGFLAADALVADKDGQYEVVKLGLQAIIKHKGRTLIVHKPNTYMNLSGKAVRYWMEKHKIKKENILILVDDIHTDFETIRLRTKGSNAGHNGLKDIDQRIGGNNYSRLKIGIGADFRQGRQVDYVLGKWSANEKAKLPEILDRTTAAIKDFVSIGAARAMTIHNRKSK